MVSNKSVTYYHCGNKIYNIGDIITKGYFGSRIIMHYQQMMYPQVYEILMENARLLFNSNKVSRLNCIFACETQEAMLNFIKKYKLELLQHNNLYINEIIPIEDNCNITKADFNIPMFTYEINGHFSYSQAVIEMNKFWENIPKLEDTEILIDSDCKVIGVNSISLNIS